MKHIFINLKRFDVKCEYGGVNSFDDIFNWGSFLAKNISEKLIDKQYIENYDIAMFLPEAHIISATKQLAEKKNNILQIGCQSVHFDDVEIGGNFGAFTSLNPAKAQTQIGTSWAIIGHSEERKYLKQIMELSGADCDNIFFAIHKILQKKVLCALNAGLKVLYCIGENENEIEKREELLSNQIKLGLGDKTKNIVLAYEPIWAIGPGKTPPSASEIQKVIISIKKFAPYDIVYGGGLKKENAKDIGSIKELDGALVALTHFTKPIGFNIEEFIDILSHYNDGVTQ